MSNKKRVSLASSIKAAISEPEESVPEEKSNAPEAKPMTYAKAKNLKQSTLYLPPQVHRKLRELGLNEDKKLHDLLLEAVDLLLLQYGLQSIDELTKE